MRYLEPQVTYTDSAELRQLAQNITRMRDPDIFARKREGMDNLAESIGVVPSEYKSQKALLEGIRKRALEIVTRAQAELRSVTGSDEFKLANFFYAARGALEYQEKAYVEAHAKIAEPGSLYWGNTGDLFRAQVRIQVLCEVLRLEGAKSKADEPITYAEVMEELRDRVLRAATRVSSSSNPISNLIDDEARAYLAEIVVHPTLAF